MSVSLLPSMLARYRNTAFIETGTYHGDGVILAMALGFKTIHSIELDPGRYQTSLERLRGIDGFTIHLGDSKDVLPEILKSLDEKATLWIDAHPLGAEDACFAGKLQWPLLGELAGIRDFSKRKDHTILIDDRNRFVDLFGTTDEEVYALLRQINSAYNIRIEAGNVVVADLKP